MRLPADLSAALGRSPRARRQFDTLTAKKQERFATYLAEAKRPETRARRLKGEILQLEDGKTHPRCNWSREPTEAH